MPGTLSKAQARSQEAVTAAVAAAAVGDAKHTFCT